MGKPISKVKKFSDERKWEDDVEWIGFPDGKQILIRIVGTVTVMARHWIKTLSGKSFPQWCPQFDSEEEEYVGARPCPAHDDFGDKTQKVIIGNCIVRHLQERGDDNPVRGFMVPHAVNDDLHDIVDLIGCDPADDDQGVDLAFRYNSRAQGNKKWGIQRGNKAPLTEEEKAYRYFDFDTLCPNFNDPEIVTQYAGTMKKGMARNKYYVVQDQKIPEGARNPFKYFSGSEKGKPWTDFPVLVDYRNEQSGENVQPTKPSTSDDIEEELPPPKEEEAPPPKKDKKPEPEEEKAPPKADPEPEPEEEKAPPKAEPKAEKPKSNGSAHPDEEIGSKEHKTLGTVPECFEAYDGTAKCQRCPVRAKCIDETDDDL